MTRMMMMRVVVDMLASLRLPSKAHSMPDFAARPLPP